METKKNISTAPEAKVVKSCLGLGSNSGLRLSRFGKRVVEITEARCEPVVLAPGQCVLFPVPYCIPKS